MSLEAFAHIWEYSPYKGIDLLVHLAIADCVAPTMVAEVHWEFLRRRSRSTFEAVHASLAMLSRNEDISTSGINVCPSSKLEKESFICKLFLKTPPAHDEKPSRRTSQDQSYLERIEGYVYLIQCGEYYKIGQTINVSKRLMQFGIQLPHKPKLLHVIATDQHDVLERKIHDYFAAKRLNGEWFALTSTDIQTFRHYGCVDNAVRDERRHSHVYLSGEGFMVPESFVPEECLTE